MLIYHEAINSLIENAGKLLNVAPIKSRSFLRDVAYVEHSGATRYTTGESAAKSTAPSSSQALGFEVHDRDDWARRSRAFCRFVVAVRIVMIRCRAQARLDKIKTFLGEALHRHINPLAVFSCKLEVNPMPSCPSAIGHWRQMSRLRYQRFRRIKIYRSNAAPVLPNTKSIAFLSEFCIQVV